MPSVVGGQVPGLVVAVPTSNGYGVSAGGRVALDASLSSCSPGLAVVNIDNGYGAACVALRALRLAGGAGQQRPRHGAGAVESPSRNRISRDLHDGADIGDDENRQVAITSGRSAAPNGDFETGSGQGDDPGRRGRDRGHASATPE